jgi:hypothetical protein
MSLDLKFCSVLTRSLRLKWVLNYLALNELLALVIAVVEVKRSHDSLNGIAADVGVVRRRVRRRVNVGVEVHHLAYAVQTLALHNLGAGRREEALVVGRILAIKIIGDNGVEYGIAQVFEPLVVLPNGRRACA